MDIVNARNELREAVREKLGYGHEYSDEEVIDLIDDCILDSLSLRLLSVGEKRRIGKEVFDSLRRLDILQSFIEDRDVTEIMINGHENVFVEKAGALTRLDRGFESEEKLMDVIQQIVAGCNRTVNEASPIVDARLRDGSRVNIVLPPVALSGPTVTIRRFPEKPITMESLISYGSLSEETAGFLKTLVEAGYNIFISGGTGSGKTTFLNVLSGFIPSDERVITIEDSAELRLQGIQNLVSLETRNGGPGTEEISIRDLIRSSLRMRPDRIVVGEVRGGEALDMLQCLNTGHDGSMSTGHANSSRDMLSRLENMVLMAAELPLAAIRQQIASGLDIIVHLGRLRDRSRKVLNISEVRGYENGEISISELYGFIEEGYENGRVIGSLRKKGELENVEKLLRSGLSLG
ncbi:MAG: CpaF family protein [Lachnospiraceae bacterium]|nr:CpaF family protein [Lachnospiraceae bacterium]